MTRTLSSLLSLVLALALVACTGDPVRSDAIAKLGPEDPGGPGPDHRPGTPCLLCHSKGGPASSKAFAVAGTVYVSEKAGADGAEGVTVQFVDSRGGAPVVVPTTGPTGNFYVPIADWADLAFPLKVGLYADSSDAPPKASMTSLIGREGSCNFCHRPPPEDADDNFARTSAGQINYGGPGPGPGAAGDDDDSQGP